MASKPAKAMECLLKKNGHLVAARNEQELVIVLISRFGGTQDAWRQQVRAAIKQKKLVVEEKNGHVVGYRTPLQEQSAVGTVKSPSPKYHNASPKVAVA